MDVLWFRESSAKLGFLRLLTKTVWNWSGLKRATQMKANRIPGKANCLYPHMCCLVLNTFLEKTFLWQRLNQWLKEPESNWTGGCTHCTGRRNACNDWRIDAGRRQCIYPGERTVHTLFPTHRNTPPFLAKTNKTENLTHLFIEMNKTKLIVSTKSWEEISQKSFLG